MQTVERQKRDHRYTFRMTADEAEVLEAAAKKLGAKPSDVARMGVFAVGIATAEEAVS